MNELPKIEDIIDLETGQPMKKEIEDWSRELVPSDASILREVMPRFDFNNPPENPQYIAHVLAHSCIKYNGLGLAAPQIGMRYRAFIITGNPMICMFNPEIVGESEEESYMEEGCLSFPNLLIKIKRPEVVRVRFTMPNGQVDTRNFEGITSRCVQHELDHLDGILFMDLATDIHLEQARKKRKKLNRQQKNV